MNTQIETKRRDAILVEEVARIRVMGLPVLEALPSRSVPYEQVDPFILLMATQPYGETALFNGPFVD